METYSNFSVRKVEKDVLAEAGAVTREVTARQLNTDKKKMEAVRNLLDDAGS